MLERLQLVLSFLFSNRIADTLIFPETGRRLAFTCCDMEPAVLARNLVLFGLIADRYPAQEIAGQHHALATALWNLFYHLFIPQSSLKILQDQARTLLKASVSFDAWLLSSYAKFIKFLDKETLVQLRHCWSQYAVDHGDDRFGVLARAAITERSQLIGASTKLHGLRSVGPMWSEAAETMAHAYRNFWRTGVAGGNPEDIRALGNKSKGLVNPMFAISSAPKGTFAVHRGTEPLLGFHVAEAFGDESWNRNVSVVTKVSRVVGVAKNQFHDWCISFKKYVAYERVTINLFCGDALTLCHELQLELTLKEKRSEIVRAYIKPWSSRPLVLDGSVEPKVKQHYAPFDVIDTSNLGDHVGLINILSAASPLLRRDPSAALYTENLLVASNSIETQLPASLGSEVATFSLLLGLAPVGYLARVVCEAVGNEAARNTTYKHFGGMRQHHMRVRWICLELADPTAISVPQTIQTNLQPITFEPTELAHCLFGIYKNMFAREDPTKLASQMERMQIEIYSTDLQRYTRAGFVAFLHVVRSRVRTNWNVTIGQIVHEIDLDQSSSIGSENRQDLYTQLYLFDLPTIFGPENSPRQIEGLDGLLRKPDQDTGFLAQDNIPPIIYVALVVPRYTLRNLETMDPDSQGNPVMYLSIGQNKGERQFDHHFSSFHCFFGTMDHMDGTDTLKTEEDHRGWLGGCDLLVSCPIPALWLLFGPRDGIEVSLRIIWQGQPMWLYKAGLDEPGRLFVCQDDPGLSSSRPLPTQKRWIDVFDSEKPSPSSTLVKMNTMHQASHLQKRIDFVHDWPESKDLADGADVTLTQSGPCTTLLQYGKSQSRRLVYPFCIQATQSTIHIEKQSSWVVIEVPISSTLDIAGDY